MKELIKLMLYLDEKTGKFSTSKFMTLVLFYLIIGLNIKALYIDKEVKNASFLTECFLITSSLYFGRRFNFKSKDSEFSSNEKTDGGSSEKGV